MIRHRAFVALGLAGVLMLLASFAREARADVLQGHVHAPVIDPRGDDLLYDEGIDRGLADVAVRIVRLGAPPGEEYEDLTFTDPEGAYSFDRVFPGGIYQVSLPFLSPDVGYEVVERTAMGPQVVPPAPSGVIPQPGGPTIVDLPILGGVGPCAGFSPPHLPNVVLAGIFYDANEIEGGNALERGGYCTEGDQGLLDTPAAIVLTPLDPPGLPVVVWTGDPYATGPENGGAAPTESVLGVAVFDALPLAAGQRVRVEIDPDQAALDGYVLISPGRVDVVYQDGTAIPAVEFRIRPAKDLPGSVFVEAGVPNGVLDGADRPLAGLPVSLWDFTDLGAGPVRTLESGPDGSFVFERVPYGVYRVQIDRSYVPYRVRQIYTADPVPANFAFTPLTCPDDVPPEITCPDDVEATSSDATGAVVTFAAPVVLDDCDPDPLVTVVPPSGSFFPVGTTEVRVTAVDARGNTSTCSFRVHVRTPRQTIDVLQARLAPVGDPTTDARLAMARYYVSQTFSTFYWKDAYTLGPQGGNVFLLHRGAAVALMQVPGFAASPYVAWILDLFDFDESLVLKKLAEIEALGSAAALTAVQNARTWLAAARAGLAAGRYDAAFLQLRYAWEALQVVPWWQQLAPRTTSWYRSAG